LACGLFAFRIGEVEHDAVRHVALFQKVELAEAVGESRSRMLESVVLLWRMEHSFQADEPSGSV